jgi:anti-sigma regulatory factor (Ser/Thr protein kinase)
MDKGHFISHNIEDKSFVSYVKREIRGAARQASFSEIRVGVVDIVVSELISNMTKHAGKGELLYRFADTESVGVFEILCIDSGPGIKDIAHAMKDGVTSTNTLGQGLGALKRLSDSFHVYSILKWGTICYCRIYATPQQEAVCDHPFKFSTLNLPKPGQKVSGDGFHVIADKRFTRILMGDGLGHGKEAFQAMQIAVTRFKVCREEDPVLILRFIHESVRQTRGLVATVVTIDHHLNKWRICGIGNIVTRLVEGLITKDYICYNGIVGLNIPSTLKNHEADLVKNQCLIMTSDGIKKKWDIVQFPMISRHDPMILAAAIYKESARKNDDMSIFIART